MSWNSKDLPEIFQAVAAEYDAASGSGGSGGMQAQIEAWSKMQDLFTWQHQSLSRHRKALASKWTSGGASAYLAQVDNVLGTLSTAASTAYGNMIALSNMKQSLDKHYPVIKQAFEDYKRDWQQQLADYGKKKQKYDSEGGVSWVKDHVLGDAPKEPDYGEVIKPYLAKARKAANTLSNDYASNNSSLLADPPKYKGPHVDRAPNKGFGPLASGLVATGTTGGLATAHSNNDDAIAPAGPAAPTPPPPGTDPGPVLASGTPPVIASGGGGPLPVISTSGPATTTPVGPAFGPLTLPPSGYPRIFPRVPRGVPETVPENEFLPRGSRPTPSVLGRNSAKLSIDRSRVQPAEEIGGPGARRSGPQVLGERRTKISTTPEEETAPRVIEAEEPMPEQGSSSRILGAEEKPGTQTERAAGRGSRRRRRRELRADGNGSDSWAVDHEGNGVIASAPGDDGPADAGPTITNGPGDADRTGPTWR